MTEEEIKQYSDIYRKHQIRLAKIIAVLIIFVAILLIIFGVIIAFISDELLIRIFGVVMTVMGIFDIPLAIWLIKKSKKTFMTFTDEECAKRYLRIYGYKKK